MLRANLDICLTIAGFCEAKPSSDKLDAACKRAATQGVEIAQRLMAKASDQELPDLERRMERLRGFLADSPVNGASAPAPGQSGPATRASRGAAAEKLTRRELEVLRYIAEGHSTKKVAEILGITFKTAACHRYRVMDKLGIHETANLVRYAIRQGMVKA